MGNIKNNAIRAKLLPMIGCVLMLLLYVAPCKAQIPLTQPVDPWNIDSDTYQNTDLLVWGELNLKVGAVVQAVYMFPSAMVTMEPGSKVIDVLYVDSGCTVVISGGIVVGTISLPEYNTSTNIEVHGYDFGVDDVYPYEEDSFIPIPDGTSILTGCYQNGTPFILVFEGGVPINLVLSTPSVTEIAIDIKPGSDTNPINLKSKGLVPVAVLATDGSIPFDPTTATIKFAGVEPERWSMEDVDGDGDEDLLLHFKIKDLQLPDDSTEATLTVETIDDGFFEASDTVHVVPSKK